MRAFARSLLAAAISLAFIGGLAPQRVVAADNVEDYLKCPMSSEIKNKDGAMGWWYRRSAEQQRIILALPCEERFVPIVCVFLYDPDLIGCSNKGIAEYRANKACEAKGLDLLSQEMADCKEKFKKTFKQPFSATTS
ncbi:MAG: hypothetical protein WA943_13030 [Parvibaculum sp.]|uniref:hypothetical protein n=1 Tax=Parvibaculum sp. TaxID=2024848 RepID=UPI003C77B441